jgi:two-component system, OmpR family, sensor histidine kinase KdpD
MPSKEPRSSAASQDVSPTKTRGRLKVYVGAGVGVGKTYHMLEQAHQLRSEGHDVVLGFIETHGRPGTAALIHDLEIIPHREVSYRGVVLKEMDVDAVLARRPRFAIVDELAHTNAPGCRQPKRYQDVEELLKAGINVIAAVNIQHVQSLSPIVKRLTGVTVTETIPDSFLARAEEIVDVDVSTEKLLQRVREGKIYPIEQVTLALRNFFRPSNLAILRELTLREVAHDIGRQREESALLKEGRAPQRSVGAQVPFASPPTSTPSKTIVQGMARSRPSRCSMVRGSY